jgi:hypothetical protein
MTWAEWMLIVPTCCYLASALYYVKLGQVGFAIAFGCYALANVGLMIAAVQGRING